LFNTFFNLRRQQVGGIATCDGTATGIVACELKADLRPPSSREKNMVVNLWCAAAVQLQRAIRVEAARASEAALARFAAARRTQSA